MSAYRPLSETQRNRSLYQRMFLVHAFLFLCALVVVARLLELQLLRGDEFLASAQAQHYGGVVLPARRGEILALSSKTGETSILATNTTLDLVYVDPLITDDPTLVAETLADILVTPEFCDACAKGAQSCPRELMDYFAPAFDPFERVRTIKPEQLLEPLPKELPLPSDLVLPDVTEVRRRFARNIEELIAEKRVRFVPLMYGATKLQIRSVQELGINGINVNVDGKLIYADPEEVNQSGITETARKLSGILEMDAAVLRNLLRSRPLRYVSVMRRLPPVLSARIREVQQQSQQETLRRKKAAANPSAAEQIADPLRSIALLAEHWRFYPDSTLASNVVGFLNATQEAQYGIERTFDPQLRGQEGLISTVSDPTGGQILTAEQTIVDPKDGDSVVLTVDRSIQEEVEAIMERSVKDFEADSGQAIVLDPKTGRILAMVNAPLFDSNNYSIVYEKEPIYLDEGKRK
ncbi:MAG: hypothetical protein PHI23_02860, partial [Candidatus Peribacteraceae bacterium]|nr:hypothetical protein [Candidatus Peribacteraceae bacterium]